MSERKHLKGRRRINKNISMDPKLIEKINQVADNFSRFLEEASIRELRRRKRSGHYRDMEN